MGAGAQAGAAAGAPATATTTKKSKHSHAKKAAPPVAGAEQPAAMPEASAGASAGAEMGGAEPSAMGTAEAPKPKSHHRSAGGKGRMETDQATAQLRAEQLQRINTGAAPPANAKVKSSAGASAE